MKGTLLFFITILIIFLTSCKKEIGKMEYILSFQFQSGSTIDLTGRIFEKDRKSKKYKDQIDDGYWMKEIEKKGLYLDFANDNTTMALKSPDNILICNDHWEFWKNFPLIQSGHAEGDIYLEGSYTQKGRAYTVENGTFEFYWRNAEVFGMTDTILKGTWTLKRK
jgi:hypothetical protein